jgi:hypothetical protein
MTSKVKRKATNSWTRPEGALARDSRSSADSEPVFYREITDRAVWKIHQVCLPCPHPLRSGEKPWLVIHEPSLYRLHVNAVPGGSHNEEGFFALADVMNVTSADRTSDRQLFDKPVFRPSGKEPHPLPITNCDELIVYCRRRDWNLSKRTSYCNRLGQFNTIWISLPPDGNSLAMPRKRCPSLVTA